MSMLNVRLSLFELPLAMRARCRVGPSAAWRVEPYNAFFYGLDLHREVLGENSNMRQPAPGEP